MQLPTGVTYVQMWVRSHYIALQNASFCLKLRVCDFRLRCFETILKPVWSPLLHYPISSP